MKKMKKMMCVLLGLIMVAMCCVGCGTGSKSGDAKGDIKIGLAGPMTGDSAIWGQSSLKAAQIAVDEFNEKGGINGRKVVIVGEDDKGDPKEAATVAQKFVNNKEILAIVGHNWSSCALTAGPIYQKHGLPYMVVTASNPKIADLGDYVFRVSLTDTIFAKRIAEYAVLNMGMKNIAIIHDNMDLGTSIKDVFSENAKKNGATITAVESYTGGQDRDFSVQLTKMAETNPDGILLSSLATEAGLIVQQAKQLGIKTQFIGPDGLDDQTFLDVAGDAAEGTIVATLFNRGIDEPAAKAFIEKYEAKYNEPVFSCCPYAYDGMLTVLDALKRAKSIDRKGLRDALEQTNDANLAGITGTISFDENGDRPAGWIVMMEVKNGKFEVKEIYK
jgi:branched-chain amino acid transport system substrate-binding protein